MYHAINLFSDGSERVPYNVPAHPVYARESRLSRLENMRAAHHWHDDLEFSLMLEGHMTYDVNGESIVLHAGEGLFVNARQLHGNYSADATDGRYICVLVHPSLLSADAYLDETCVAPLKGNNALPYLILRDCVPWQAELLGLIRAAHDAYNGADAARALTAQSIFFRMAAVLLEHMPEDSGLITRADKRLASLRDMIGHIQKNYADKVALQDIADAGHMGISACCALFRRQFRQTPIEYLMRYRLDKSLALLKNPNLSVTEIALAVGFSGSSYYAECFRRFHGMTPSEYRGSVGGRCPPNHPPKG